jgi:hypothetical protein
VGQKHRIFCHQEGFFNRLLGGGEETGPNPTDRGKKGRRFECGIFSFPALG